MTVAPSFVHLRVHSEYSIVDSIVRIDALVQAAGADAQPAIALTDSANLFGWIKFYRAARAAGIKPICGADCWLSNDTDRDRPYRLLLLARNRTGYLQLCELLSKAWLVNEWRGRGELRREWLDRQSCSGLIALSGAHQGDVGAALLNGNAAQAEQLARGWAADFPGSYYLEVQRGGAADAETQTRAAARLAAQCALPIVATHPVQFLAPQDFRAHEARVCIAEGETLGNPRRARRFGEDQFLLSQAQMRERFADLPAALANSVEIAKRCSVDMTLGQSRLPEFPTPNGIGIDIHLRDLARDGLLRRMPVPLPDAAQQQRREQQYQARLERECGMIIEMGFAGYFLIVADFINWAKANGVPVGPGRGSGAGSLVAYALGITDLDPIPYALLFERFLNPERVSMPDFDIDFCQDNRHKVIEYVRDKYGAGAVSQIATFGTMASKAVIRDAGRVLDMSYTFCDQLSKLIPVVQNKPLSLAKAREAEPLLAERERNEVEVRELLELAAPLEDLARNVGMHAGGVLIAPGKLTDFCPLYKAPGTDAVISQYDKDDVEAIGLVKFDFLGLRNLTIIEQAVATINSRRRDGHGDAKLDLAKLSFDDPAAYQVLKDGNTVGVFQVESDGMKKLLRKLQPDRFEDIIAVLALYRPGPLGSGMVDDFVLRKKGQQKIDYFHPDLTDCLEPTYGVIVYQEQVMQIAQTVGGYTLGSADLLRRAMGKKKPEEMATHRDTFVNGAIERGYAAQLATQLFDLMAKFAEYGFNKSHTAAYAVLTYQTAWLKAKYPAEFIAATLTSEMSDTDKVRLFVADARDAKNGVEVLLPDINESTYRFEPVGDRSIRYGLGAIKGVGESAVINIIEARREQAFTDLYDFCARIDRRIVNRRAIEALVRAGAFDRLDADRAKLLANVARAIEVAEHAERCAAQVGLFDADADAGVQIEWLRAPPFTPAQQLTEEKSALGFYLSGHLFTAFAAEVRRMVRLRIADLQPAREPIWFAGIVAQVRMQNTRRGRMCVVTLDDMTGQVELPVYSELFDKHRDWLAEDQLLFVNGRVSRDDYSGGERINVDRLCDLTEARALFGKRLRIRLNGNTNPKALKGAIEPFSAPVRGGAAGLAVVLEYTNQGARCQVELPAQWRVRPDPNLIAALAAEFNGCEPEIVYA